MSLADSLEVLVGVGKKKRVRRGPSPERARAQLQEMIRANDYQGATPIHLVALYEYAHGKVYRVAPVEFQQAVTWKLAAFAATRIIQDHFDGKASEAVEYLRWAWRREAVREKNRADTDTFRLGWRYLFSGRYVTDYRIAKARGQC